MGHRRIPCHLKMRIGFQSSIASNLVYDLDVYGVTIKVHLGECLSRFGFVRVHNFPKSSLM